EVARWSPDGSKIAEAGSPTIYNADRSVFTTLPYPLPGFDPDTIFGCNVWSPDGTRLACEVLNDQHPERNGLYTFHFPDASDLVRVTTAPVDDIPADYSPGGSRIAFVRDNPARPALCQPCPLRGPHRWNRAAQAYRLGDLTRERGQLVSGWQVDRLRREWADLCHPPRRQRAPADPHRHRWQPLLRQGPSLVTQREQDRARPVPPAKRGARHLHDECGRHGPHSGHRLADLSRRTALGNAPAGPIHTRPACFFISTCGTRVPQVLFVQESGTSRTARSPRPSGRPAGGGPAGKSNPQLRARRESLDQML